MKNILVIGLGSIGRRHAKVFRNLGHEIFGVDNREDRILQAKEEIDIKSTSSNIDEIIEKYKLDAALICTPPNSHTEIALKLAKNKINIFVEKPLANNESKLDELSNLCEINDVVFYTAYCYRFIPSLQKVKKLLSEDVIGKIFSLRLQISSYLPDWHPWEDYRNFYMAHADQGGGALLDESHGIDLLRWLFGEIQSLSAYVGKVSNLEINSDDLAVLNLKFKSGIIGEAHFDLLGRSPRIGLELIGEEGTLIWDRIEPKISIYSSKENKWTTEEFDKSDFVTSYDLQAKHFLDCLDKKVKPITSLQDGVNTLKVLTAAFKSSEEKRFIDIK